MSTQDRVKANLALIDEYGDPALRWLRRRGKSLTTIADPKAFVPLFDALHDRWRTERPLPVAARNTT